MCYLTVEWHVSMANLLATIHIYVETNSTTASHHGRIIVSDVGEIKDHPSAFCCLSK